MPDQFLGLQRFTARSGGRPLPSHRAAHDFYAATASPHAATPHDAAAQIAA